MEIRQMSRISCISVILVLCGLSYTNAQQQNLTECRDGWDSIGLQCYKYINVPLGYYDALATCRSMGAELVNLWGYESNKDIAALVDDSDDFWIGFRIENDEPLNSDNSAASLSHGFWSASQPDDSNGQCGCVTKDASNYYNDGAWTLGLCFDAKPFVCVAPTCPTGSFFCANGGCVQDAECNEVNDCGDLSDESNCPDLSHFYLTGDGGTFETEGTTYEDNLRTQWTIEADIGKIVQLEFTALNTEEGLDIVEIWIGSRSTETLLARLTGNYDTDALGAFYSTNHLMIVKLFTDSSIVRSGFTAVWSPVTSLTTNDLTATNDDNVIENEGFPNGFQSGLRNTWVITSEDPNAIITLTIDILEVGLSGFIDIRDGSEVDSPLIVSLPTSQNNIRVVQSTGTSMHIYFYSSAEYHSGSGFSFTYRQGCVADITESFGLITSPGNGILGYPKRQSCRYIIRSPESIPMRLLFSQYRVHTAAPTPDVLKVYDGEDDTTTPIYEYDALNPDTEPDTLDSTTGIFLITFATSAIQNDIGFIASFATECPNPAFNPTFTLMDPADLLFPLDVEKTITCETGYYFAQQEHLDELSVTMTCQAGHWDVNRYPHCLPKYCGEPPSIDNGYIASSTGVVFGLSVTYQCHGGFGLNGAATINCLEDGSWETAPTCENQDCSALLDVDHATKVEIRPGNGGSESFGAIFEYQCEDGFQINGSPRLICDDTQQWSADVPECVRITCCIPEIDLATLDSGNDTTIEFEDSVTVTCDDGYQLDIAEMTCTADGTLDQIPTCEDIDECDTDHGGCVNAECVNNVGGHVCTCNEGHEPTDDPLVCQEIDECTTMSPCDQPNGAGLCAEDPDGTYTCSCAEGYVLFTADGTEGFTIPDNEDGTRDGDMFRLDHTCVPKQCDDLIVDNAEILWRPSMYHFQDIIDIQCLLGFEMVGESTLECLSDGSWNTTVPTCEPAQCEYPETPAIHAWNSAVPPAGPLDYLATITFSCTEHLTAPQSITRQCNYDVETDSYIVPMDDTICPVINCGEPPAVAGADFTPDTIGDDTYLNAEHAFTCLNGYDQHGQSFADDLMFRCDENGNWDFGNMECRGPTCLDPGTPPGAIQVAENYAQGAQVTYECERPGFEVVPTTTYTCTLDGIDVSWVPDNTDLPECRDVTEPEFNDCPTEDVVIDQLTAPNRPTPTPIDNSGDIDTLEIIPIHFTMDIVRKASVDVSYIATDHAGNVGRCDFTIRVRDLAVPTITCPASQVYTLTASEMTIDYADFSVSTNDDTPDDVVSLIWSPETLVKNAADIGTEELVTITAVDLDGNEAECSFIVIFEAAKCSDWALNTPANGASDCTGDGADGFRCTLTCNDGFYFHDRPADSQDGFDMTCTPGEDWTPYLQAPDCVAKTERAVYVNTDVYVYRSAGDAVIDEACVDYYTSAFDTAMESIYTDFSVQCTNSVGLDVTVSAHDMHPTTGEISLDQTMITLHMTVQFTPTDTADQPIQTCSLLWGVLVHRLTDNYRSQAELTGDGTCPTVTSIADENSQESTGYICSDDDKLYLDPDNNVCLPCPLGTFVVGGGTCDACPIDTFSDNTGMSECEACPDGKRTYYTGAKDVEECRNTCESFDMLHEDVDVVHSCIQCGADEYLDAAVCADCPDGTKTRGIGAASADQCLVACSDGEYSSDGYAPCTECPLNFYRSFDDPANSCVECGSALITTITGAVSNLACTDAFNDNCPMTNCVDGRCSMLYHKAVCDQCETGYEGLLCDVEIDHCLSEPCYYNQECTNTIDNDGFTCTCPAGFAGDRCEIEDDQCAPLDENHCNNGQCLDLVEDFQCLCMSGFTGDTCTESVGACESDPCENEGACTQGDHLRRVCVCPAGFTGVSCETNIDECASDPCLFGGECVDGVNEYTCNCVGDWDGDNCENVPDVCGTNPCDSTGECFSNYRNSEFGCICTGAHFAATDGRNGTWYEDILSVSPQPCEFLDLCAVDSPCVNGAECSMPADGSGNVICACTEGYTGGVCQHAIVDCVDNICQHGTCTDRVPGFECACDAGFTADGNGICSLDTDECTPNPCFVEGTNDAEGVNGCMEGIGTYHCVCNPGYEGQNCDINIDDCACDPCVHSEECVDEVNGFECRCLLGWSGDRCELIEDNCLDLPCDNEATCHNVFADYHCECANLNYGKNCSLTESVCRDANPCIDPLSTCTDGPDGATCECSFDTMGVGCEIGVNYCEPDDEGFTICKNGGICNTVGDGFQCDCPRDFTGLRCEESVDDCDGRVCSGPGALPVDGIEVCHCECAIENRMAGENCDKPIDTDYDISFFSPTLTGIVTLDYPFKFTNDVGAVSVGFWFRFADSSASGNMFTLFGLEERYVTAQKQELIRVDHNHVTLSFGDSELQLDYRASVNLGDKQWYYMAVTWENENGHIEVRVNSVRMNQADGYAVGYTMPQYGWTVLGCKYDPILNIPIEYEGFHGVLSQVNVWIKELNTNTEIPLLTSNRTYLVESGLISTWSNFVIGAGAEVIYGSTAGNLICSPGDILECDQAPDAASLQCPPDQYVIGTSRLTAVEWEEPVVSGNSFNPVTRNPSGTSFVWGKSSNYYTARGENGHTTACSFDIFVQYSECTTPADPLGGGSVECDSSAAPFVTCTPSCPDGSSFSVPTPNFYTCGPSGSFNKDNIFLKFRFPACAVTQPARLRQSMHLVYPDVLSCLQIENIGTVKNNLTSIIMGLDALWGETEGNPTGGFCGNDDTCEDKLHIETTCTDVARRRRKRETNQNLEADIVIDDLQDHLFNADGLSLTPEEILEQLLHDQAGFALDNIAAGIEPDLSNAVVEADGTCEPLQVLIGDNCVDCAAGTHYDADTSTCVQCPLGQYQPDGRQETCLTCPDGETTELIGSTEAAECFVECAAGEMYDEAADQCNPCEIGFYQPDVGQFFCYPCGALQTTPGEGSISEDSCENICEDGTQFSATNECEDCLRGFYRKANVEDACEPCPVGFVTPDVRSVLVEQCTEPDCAEGHFIDGDVCTPCDRGTYQDEKWQDVCEPCLGDTSTVSTASTHEDQCLFHCPAGEWQEGDDEVCTPCAIGYFKDNDVPGNVCVQCPGGRATDDTGSTVEDDCTHEFCEAGEYPNEADEGCRPCELGFYQPESAQSECIECPADTSTRETGAITEDLCVAYCPSGQQFDDSEPAECIDCERGYYKDNTVQYLFGECTMCDPDFITPDDGVAATSDGECTVSNCTAGQMLTGANVCEDCEVGWYQPDKWQENCIQCEDQRTTSDVGSTSIDQCSLNCDLGHEDGGNDVCVECPTTKYKDTVGPDTCTVCPTRADNGREQLTAAPGAVDVDDCEIEACRPGEYIGNDNRCHLCARGSYQPIERQQQPECLACPCVDDDCTANPITTLGEGKSELADCVENCISGMEYDLEAEACVPVPRGYFRQQHANPVQDVAVLCPIDRITPGVGAILAEECSIANCTVGFFLDITDNVCVSCPRGTYTDEVWQQDECTECPATHPTTIEEESTSVDDCKLYCPLGYELPVDSTTCVPCPKGKYNDRTQFYCQDCPDSKTTPTTGATSADMCSILDCDLGQYNVPNTETCEPCGQGTYQDERAQEACKPCPDGGLTPGLGSADESACFDPCAGECVAEGADCIADADADTDFTCICAPHHTGTYPDCTHKCEGDYCYNGAECTRDQSTDEPVCDCTDNYEGPQCLVRKEPQSNTPYIIGGAVGGFLFLLLILLMIALCCWCCKSPAAADKEPQPPIMNQMYEPLPGSMQHYPQKYTGSLAGSMARSMNTMTMFAPTMPMARDDGRSAFGYNGVMGDKRYLFYEDQEDQQAPAPTPQPPQGYPQSNMAYDGGYEEKFSSINFS